MSASRKSLASMATPRLTALLFLCACCALSTDAPDYCHLESCRGRPHVMCAEHVPETQCDEMEDMPLTPEEREVILVTHNKWRSMLAQSLERSKAGPLPPARNMHQLVWSNELEEIARQVLLRCFDDRVGCKNSADFVVGDNSAYHSNVSAPVTALIKAFHRQLAELSPSVLKSYTPSMRYSSYTQLVWAKTSAIGCDRAKGKSPATGTTVQAVYCLYGPIGNMVGEPVYEEGAPCSGCPDGTGCSATYEGLCVATSWRNIPRNETDTVYIVVQQNGVTGSRLCWLVLILVTSITAVF